MANTRIRYMTNTEGVLLTSRRNFRIASGIEVKVVLDLGAKKYKIVDAVTGHEIASGGNTRNISVLKIQGKKALSQLGAEFDEEVRNRAGSVG